MWDPDSGATYALREKEAQALPSGVGAGTIIIHHIVLVSGSPERMFRVTIFSSAMENSGVFKAIHLERPIIKFHIPPALTFPSKFLPFRLTNHSATLQKGAPRTPLKPINFCQ